ncbi:MAG TPA: hypothetical protein VN284_02195 [Rhizobium sp.]|uniref:hypothetical protein n=1 Tax=Rhizobium sp. F40D2 TaxID=3453141 RepID=UPI002D1408BD|nr:hypothetical protein [Rhizobium sp.]
MTAYVRRGTTRTRISPPRTGSAMAKTASWGSISLYIGGSTLRSQPAALGRSTVLAQAGASPAT